MKFANKYCQKSTYQNSFDTWAETSDPRAAKTFQRIVVQSFLSFCSAVTSSRGPRSWKSSDCQRKHVALTARRHVRAQKWTVKRSIAKKHSLANTDSPVSHPARVFYQFTHHKCRIDHCTITHSPLTRMKLDRKRRRVRRRYVWLRMFRRLVDFARDGLVVGVVGVIWS